MTQFLDGLPAVNAFFNAVTALCLIAGYLAIKQQRRELHRALMIAAFASATLFLVGYLVHTVTAGNTQFLGSGLWRTSYRTLLVSHMILAVVVLPLVLRTLYLGIRARYDSHRRVAVWTWPLWIYVSVTGVIVYLMLFHLPAAWLPTAVAALP